MNIARLACIAVLVSVATPEPASPGALELDGSDDRVTVPYSPTFPADNFTLMAWIQTPTPASDAAILARGDDDVSGHLAWQLQVTSAGTLSLRVDDSSGAASCYPVDCGGGPVPECTLGDLFVGDDVAHHVAVTRSLAGELALYVDGELGASCTSSTAPSTDNAQRLTLGCTHEAPEPPDGTTVATGFLPGRIESAAMWFIDLTEGQVLDRYCRGVNLDEDGIVGLWEIDEDSGQVVSDLSPAGNDGFLGTDADPGGDDADPAWLVGPFWGPGEAADLRARFDRAADTLELTYTPACDGSNHAIYGGDLATVSSYDYGFTRCFAGPRSATVESPEGSVFFVVVGQRDGAEGSYGRSSLGVERPEDVDTPTCDAARAPNVGCFCP